MPFPTWFSRPAPLRQRVIVILLSVFRPSRLSSLGRVGPKKPFDVLSIPILGPFLRAQSGRRFIQAALFLIAIAVIVDGLTGSQVSAANLAGVLPWTYWRAFVVIILLAMGNFFCMACPFMFFREFGRRLGLHQRPWPRALRSKWFGIALLVLLFGGYEVFSLWDKPIWTAWLIINYFIVAFAIDAVFRGASFCKYVCPIGQFQFVTSLVSPLEVKVREPGVCASCKTHDCLRGNAGHRGCELDLYLPRKSGNLDCTFCLDCVRACPHDNIGVMAVAPGMDIVRDPPRASVGRLSGRLDLAALALVFVFAAFANAAFMTAPVASFEDNLAARLGLTSTLPVTSVLLLIALVMAPATLAALSGYASRAASHVSATMRELVCRFSMCLVPLGASMWAGHFLFHLNVGWNSGWTTVQQAASRWHLLGSPNSTIFSPLMGAGTLSVLQTLLLDAGLLLTLYLVWRIALVYARRMSDALSPGRTLGWYRDGSLRRGCLDYPPADANAGAARPNLASMRCVDLVWLLPGLLMFGLSLSNALADGGVVRLREAKGPLLVTVFTAAEPVQDGLCDVSVLVQRRDSGDAILDATVELVFIAPAASITEPVGQLCGASGAWLLGRGSKPGQAQLAVPAYRSLASNKLLYAAPIRFGTAGNWQLEALVKHRSDAVKVACGIRVGSPPRRLIFWLLTWLCRRCSSRCLC